MRMDTWWCMSKDDNWKEKETMTYEQEIAEQGLTLSQNMGRIHLFLQHIATGTPEGITMEACGDLIGDLTELRQLKNRMIAVLGMASLYAASGGMDSTYNEMLLETYIGRVEEMESADSARGYFLEILREYAREVWDSGLYNGLSREIKEIVAYVVSHVNEPLTAGGVARELGMNPDRMSRRIREECGYSFPKMVTRAKIVKAKALLKTTERSVTEIAYQLSYSSPGQFADVFRRETGMSPSAFRKKTEIPKELREIR